MDNLDEIVTAADAVMVARGDLGVEVPIDRVPVLQKRIVAAGRRLGRPVIVATQMLESMMEQPRPTRAEATDVANAVFDGADALMLSGETAAGRHPLAAVETMARIISTAEDYQRSAYADSVDLHRSAAPGPHGPNVLGRLDGDESTDIPDMVSAAAVYAARELGAHRLVAFSQSGATGRLVARYRPSTPIVVFTNDRTVARRLQLVWGVRPHLLEERLEHHDEVVEVVDRELLASHLAEPGQLVVVLMGDPIRERRQTNLMRVHRVRTAAEWERARRESADRAWGDAPISAGEGLPLIPLRDLLPRRRRPVITVALIAVNLLFFFYELTLGPALPRFLMQAAFVPARAFEGPVSVGRLGGEGLSVLLSMFLHGGWMHVGGNMLYLWIFGDNIEDRLGHARFLLFYLLCGYAASFAHAFFNAGSTVPAIGASGAIAGVLGAYLVLHPGARIVSLVFLGFFFTTVEVPAIVFLPIWFLIQFFSGLASLGGPESGGGVAWFAHIGGFVAGPLLLFLLGGGRLGRRPRIELISS